MWIKLTRVTVILLFATSCSNYADDSVFNQGSSQKIRPLPAEYQDVNSGEFTVKKMLVNIGLNVIAKNVEDFYFKAGLLKTSIADYCVELENFSGVSSTGEFIPQEANLKFLWKETMLSFHKVNMSGVGPLTDNNNAISNKIYSWPVVSECGIDQEVIKNESGALSDNVLANRRSLSALEYLLFDSTLVSKCTAFVEPKAKEWSEKSLFEKKKDRCNYAKKVAQDVQKNAEALHTVWALDKENFTVALIDNSIFQSTDKAVNALTDALFAFEDFRDTALAIPLGVHEDCKDPSGKCLSSIEHPWSGIAAEAAIAQIQGFKEAFIGSKYDNETAFGFDDYLISKGHKDVADSIKTNLALSTQGMQRLLLQDPALRTTILNVKKENCDIFEGAKDSLDFVCQVYKDIQNVTFTLKTDVMIILALQVPTGHAGDAD